MIETTGEGKSAVATPDGKSRKKKKKKGLCKVKKFQKSKINLDGAHPTHPHQNFFWKPITDMDRTLKS